MSREEAKQRSINHVKNILEKAVEEIDGFTYKQRSGKNIEGFNLFHQKKKFSELWAFVGDNENKFHFWTNAILEDEKSRATLGTRSKDLFITNQNGEKVYNYYPSADMHYKWEANNEQEIFAEIARELSVLLGENDTLQEKGINVPREPQKISRVDDLVYFCCPNCGNDFQKAERCPECGQLIKQ